MKTNRDRVLKLYPYLQSERHFLIKPEQTHKGVTMLLSLASLTRKQWQDISQQPAHVQGCSYPNQVFSPRSHINTWSSFTILFLGYSCIYESFQPKCPFSLDTYLHKKRTQLHLRSYCLDMHFSTEDPAWWQAVSRDNCSSSGQIL